MAPMHSADFGWESLLGTDAPSGCALKAALFTTYDQADERLLVEHMLPELLKLSREPGGEGVERQCFLLELDRRLKQLHGKIVVVSSTVREESAEADDPGARAYPWIWRSILHLTVGRVRRAVQHAKLWMLHWGAPDGEGPEHLEIVVSSSNLTMSAFKGQIQAAWRACLELVPRGSAGRLETWGLLPEFVRELGLSAGAAEAFEPFLDLLARVACPDGVQFVASVPGTYSRQLLRRTPWGAAGLAAVTPPGRGEVRASILSPYVGWWTSETLQRWCDHFDGGTSRLELVWVAHDHPWGRAVKWLLPKSTLENFIRADATLLRLGSGSADASGPGSFHAEHHAADERWSHAKVYALRRGTSRRVLVTSANFSPSAWGAETSEGDLTIENFELGVCLEQATWPFDDLQPFDDPRDAATVADGGTRNASLISWARADWDGSEVAVHCRCEAGRDVEGKVRVGTAWRLVDQWRAATDPRLRSAAVRCDAQGGLPSVVVLRCDEETVTVPVFDTRLPLERETSVPPEIDESVAQTMRDELLFEQYGGRAVQEDGELSGEPAHEGAEEAAPSTDDEDSSDPQRADSYSVPAFARAREHLEVVDNWAMRVGRIDGGGQAEAERLWLQRDGELLVEAFTRLAAREANRGAGTDLGARLAAEELSLRLRHFEAS